MVWEERWHPLREEWVTIAAHRQNRPWQGETVRAETKFVPEYAGDCYLCPGNTRISGRRNEDYAGVYVFDNDHPCVGLDAPTDLAAPTGIYRNRPATGIARVVCYSPQHNSSLAQLSPGEIRSLLGVWREQYLDLAARPEINHVLLFENRGEVVGVSNPHPHCQIYATNFVFKTIADEARVSLAHWRETGRVLFQDIIAAERQDEIRILAENEHAIAFVPYFARYAYDVCVAPKRTHRSVADLSGDELSDLAAALKIVLVKFDNLWQAPFPYVMTLHQAPTDGGDYRGFHFYIAFHPPLRKPNLLKYMGGPETGGGSFISDTSPEEKAAELRAASNIHYTQSN
ncbi:galactose-1-phosphate uridylyltransferase [Capsulimonas corticalis]|uniref:Galactose-1-phosphate uridylyltransferase n=1 Tax=Capsulimonas corticalis TaxID=2219043 RepID=A0A402CVB4_9BACT|nr:galactose-1-phosphate uridylyltransferase [Capsulimonas corticalis]BDI30344.1 galactose-1-phosphate uridylyltransferase [Capsulimonas corticalis]